MIGKHNERVFLQTNGPTLLRGNINFSELFRSAKLEYLSSISWNKCFLKCYINCTLVENESHSQLTSFKWRTAPAKVIYKVQVYTSQCCTCMKYLLIFNNSWMRLSILWRIMEIEEGVIDNILRDLHNCNSYDTKAEFNNCFIIHSK